MKLKIFYTLTGCVFSLLAVSLLSIEVGQCQVSTALTSDGSLGTSVSRSNNIYNIQDGTTIGSNLFHSFANFSVGVGDIASFNGPAGIENILTRVTGGMRSEIFGTIRSQIPEANLFLMNPAGVLFGPSASLDLTGSFHITTADYIGLGENGIFHAELNKTSVLTTAPPSAFGFLVNSPKAILGEQSTLQIQPGKTLSLVGGDIVITGGSLSASDGQVSLISLKEPGNVTISELNVISVESPQLGRIEVSNEASVSVDGRTGGNVIIRSGQLVIDNARVSSNSNEQVGLSSSKNPKIDIQVTNDISLNNLALIRANVLEGENRSADINVNAGSSFKINGGKTPDMSMGLIGFIDGFTGIQTVALNGSGSAGNIEVNTEELNISGEAIGLLSWSLPSSEGSTGEIKVRSNNLTVSGEGATGGFIAANSFGKGSGRDVEINIQGGDIILDSGQIAVVTFGTGNAGNLIVQAQDALLVNQSVVQAGTAGSGNTGSTSILLDGDLDISEGSFIGTLVGSECQIACGAARDLTIVANDIVIKGIENPSNPLSAPEFTGIRTRSVAQPGGNVIINADSLEVTDNGVIRSASIGPERAGDITINLDGNFELSGKGQLLATAEGTGDGGNINVSSANFTLADEAAVTTESFSQDNDAGNAGSINLSGQDSIFLENSTVTTRAQNAVAGDITFKSDNLIQITDSNIVSEVPEGSGSAGRISVDPQFIIVQNSLIDSSANFGDGGDVTFVADSAIFIDPFSRIDTSSQFGGTGTIDIRAPIQNLGETIAPLPEEILKVAGLFAARCAAQKGGKFSSFLQGTRDGRPPGITNYLSSPLSFSTSDSESTTTTASELGLDSEDAQQEFTWSLYKSTETEDPIENCSSIPLIRS